MHSMKKQKRVRDVLIAVIFALTVISQSTKFGSDSDKSTYQSEMRSLKIEAVRFMTLLTFCDLFVLRYLFYNNELILSLFHYKWINIASLCLIERCNFWHALLHIFHVFWLRETELKTLLPIPFTECSTTTTYLRSNSHKLKILLFLPNIEST